MKFKNDMVEAAAEQLALDFACSPTDFLKTGYTVIPTKKMYGRRNFKNIPDFFRLATFGNGTVASIRPEIFTFTKALFMKMEPLSVFNADGIYIINKELEKYNMALGSFHEYYLPKTPYLPINNTSFSVEIAEESDINLLYNKTEFQNALLFNDNDERHDVLAAYIKHGNDTIGIAGASNDSERFWQIGIDVTPEYRNKGVATALVSNLTNEILRRGAIPYYGTWWSNIHSRAVAEACGYYHVWSEMSAVPLQ